MLCLAAFLRGGWKPVTKRTWIAFLAVWLMPSMVVANCGDVPPEELISGVAEDRPLSAEEQAQLVALFEGLREIRRGELREVICRPDNSSKRRDFSVQAKVSRRLNGMVLNADLTDPERRVSKSVDLGLYQIDDRLRVDLPKGTGAVQLIALTSDRLEFWRRWANRVATPNPAQQADKVVVNYRAEQEIDPEKDLQEALIAEAEAAAPKHRINRRAALVQLSRFDGGWRLDRWYYQNDALIGAEFWNLTP